MFEKIKQMGNLPIIIGTAIISTIIIIVAICIGVKIKNSKLSNANIDLSDTLNQEDNEENDELVVRVDQEVEEIEKEDEKQDEEKEESEETEENTVTNADIKYFIRVNYGANVVTIYTKDANGEYTVPYKVMVCSTGSATPTSGTYAIPSGSYSRGVWGLMFGNVWAQYFTRIKGSILFHSVPYLKRDKSTLEYWEYDKLGTTASAGCIRLTVKDAKWIYNNCPAGTKVEFYSDSNPGPLGKPTAQKISDDEEVRGWDPTDPDSDNPWKTYTSTTEKDATNKNDNTTETKPSTSTTETNVDTSENETTTPGGSETSEETTNPGQGDSSKEETTEPGQGDSSGEETTNPDQGDSSGNGTTNSDEESNEDAEDATNTEGEENKTPEDDTNI